MEARPRVTKGESGKLKFSSTSEVKSKAIEFLKQQVQGNLDAKTLQSQREYYAEKRDAINQNLYLRLLHKVNELDSSVKVLADKESLTGDINDKLKNLNERWQNSSGKFGEISSYVDDLMTAKCNVEKVVAILRDYENIDDEVDDLNAKLSDE